MSLSRFRCMTFKSGLFLAAKDSKILQKNTIQPAVNKIIFRETKLRPSQVNCPKKKNLWDKLFGKYLLATNILSSGILMMFGDILLQEIQYRHADLPERYDWARAGRMFIVGTLQGPVHHYFYKWLDRRILGVNLKTTTYKILWDQLVMSPVCIVLFFYPASLLENKSLQEATTELRSKFLTVYMADWCVWPGAQFINFYYLEPKYRVIYINIVTVIYNIFLSYMKHKESTSNKEDINYN